MKQSVDTLAGPDAGGRQSGNEPRITQGKFKLPVSEEAANQAWCPQGFAMPSMARRPQGWRRGKHTHEWDLLIAPVAGRLEFTISGQRFLVEPGDELFYPAQAIISSKNLSAGASEMLISFREQAP